jgi:hypothetical protein
VNPNSLTFPCPLCGVIVTVAVDNINIHVVPPEPGKQLKRSTITATAVGVTNHVHGRSATNG